jgi:hypothetical protein
VSENEAHSEGENRAAVPIIVEILFWLWVIGAIGYYCHSVGFGDYVLGLIGD